MCVCSQNVCRVEEFDELWLWRQLCWFSRWPCLLFAMSKFALPIVVRCALCTVDSYVHSRLCVITKFKSCVQTLWRICACLTSQSLITSYWYPATTFLRLCSWNAKNVLLLDLQKGLSNSDVLLFCDFSWYCQSHMRQVGSLIWSPCKLIGAWYNILELYLCVQLPLIEFLISAVIFYYHCSQKIAVTRRHISHLSLSLPVQLTDLKCFIFKSYSS